MIDLDEVESQFRAALKVRPVFSRPEVASTVVITDLEAAESQALAAQTKAGLGTIAGQWEVLSRSHTEGLAQLLEGLQNRNPDLIVTYRHLFEENVALVHSLGTYADMLTQTAASPVLLLPHPKKSLPLENTDHVMVVTNHAVGNAHLINWGLRIVESGGVLDLVHVEDDAVFERYMDVIGKIPGLNTEHARTAIRERLGHEAQDYLDEVATAVKEQHPYAQVKPLIAFGHSLKTYKHIVNDHDVDLLVMDTKDDDQLAMNGMSYSLTVEFDDRPLLLL